jgi:hypothetical protein
MFLVQAEHGITGKKNRPLVPIKKTFFNFPLFVIQNQLLPGHLIQHDYYSIIG